MSKEELMKIQTCVLKVNIHCDGCKQKVKKILQKIEGVFTTKIDSEQGKVTVTGSVDPSVLIKKLAKSGKHAEIWGAPKANNNNQNQSQMANQFKGMQIDNGKGGGGGGKKGYNGGGGGGGGGGGNSNGQKMGQQLNQQQMLQKMKGFQDLKLPPQLKGSVPPVNKNQKGVKFDVPEDEDNDDYSDEFDDGFSDDDDDDEFDDDEFDDLPLPSNKMKPNLMMPNAHQQMVMNAQKNGNFGGGPAKNVGKGLPGGGGGGGGKGGSIGGNGGKGGLGGSGGKGGPVGGGGGGGGGGGKGGLGGGGGGKSQNQGGGKNGSKNGGGGGGSGGLNGSKNGSGEGGGLHGGNKGNGGKNSGGGGQMIGGFPGGFRPIGGGGPPPSMSMPMGMGGQMGNIPAVQGLPANSGPPGYFSGSGSDPMQQQQYLTAVMNQQRAMGNERFQPMMYARPPPAVNYMPQNPHHYPNPYPYSYPYPYPPPYGNDQYSHAFSDENTSSCDIM